jgi:hypothetical protein
MFLTSSCKPHVPTKVRENFFIYLICHDFQKNNWSNQNFREIYIWRRGPRRLEFLSPWATALGETATIGTTGRWGQTLTLWPAASGNPSAAGHGVRTLAPWDAAAGPAYIRGRAPGASPTPSPHSSLQTFDFQHL